MKTRIISGVVGILLFAGILVLSTPIALEKYYPWILTAAIAVLAAIGVWEILNNTKIVKNKIISAISALFAAGAVVLEEVPEGATVVGVPAKVVKLNGMKVTPLDQIHIPDPVMQEICRLEGEIFALNKEIEQLKQGKDA